MMFKYKLKIEHISLFLLLLASCNTPPTPIDVNSLLVLNRVSEVESYFDRVQAQFESGEMREIQFRNEFRAFYFLEEDAARNLMNWAGNSPESHIAHLGYGIFLKRMGRGPRGYDFIQDVLPENLSSSRSYYAAARAELILAQGLTEKPYMEVFHLLDIAGFTGDRDSLDQLIVLANEMLPENVLSRMRRAHYLLPRWGGSYEEFDRFMETSIADGGTELGILYMEAIKYQDLSSIAEDSGNLSAAIAFDELALLIGEEIGDTYNADNLYSSWFTMCREYNEQSYCSEPSDFN